MKSIARLGAASLSAVLASCSHSAFPSSAAFVPGLMGASHGGPAAPYSTVYTFKGGADGSGPTGDLIDVRQVLYGTTSSGGGTGNLGTVFAVTPGGNERIVYRFTGGANGSTPISGLTARNGTLYGVTSAQLYRVSTSGTSYRALYTFGSSSAEGPLVSEKGRLYGVTRFGGLAGKGCTDRCGSVFAYAPSGSEETVYTFHGGADGGEPAGGLIAVDGNLYGTTLYGGTHNAGTVFKLTTSGHHQVLFSFDPKTDGSQPVGKLYASGGVLYGTTEYGGKNDSGTMFAGTLGGSGTIVYQFGASGDASNPKGSLTEVKGVFYGTSSNGGAHNTGTVFAVTKAGSERVLYSFSGAVSVAPGLIAVDGALYGTTAGGGKAGAGTIFKINL